MAGSFSSAHLREVLEAHVPEAATGLVIAISGGADSASLLAAIAQLMLPAPLVPPAIPHAGSGRQTAVVAPPLPRMSDLALVPWHIDFDRWQGLPFTGGRSTLRMPAREDERSTGNCSPPFPGGVLCSRASTTTAQNHRAKVLVVPRVLQFRNLPVRAVHVDHSLQPGAVKFRAACEASCREYGIALSCLTVVVPLDGGVSIEAAARDARYAAIAGQLAVGECLLTAHHAEDQAETLLLQLLRGAGLKGLSAMPVRRSLGRGWHVRPLLDVAKHELREFGRTQGIRAEHDPMNVDDRFDRAYLRAHLWPLLRARWPGATTAVSRAARHLADAQDLLDRSTAATVEKLRDGATLSVTGLRVLTAAERLGALRYWIATRAAPPPSTARLQEALRQLLEADADHMPVIVWREHALRRYRDRLFLTAARPPAIENELTWPVASVGHCDLGGSLGRLRWSRQMGGLDAARLPGAIGIRRRRGGEKLRPQPRSRTRSLQHLCQSMGVTPWMRDALPLLYAGDDLIGVGDLWQDARWCVAADAPGLGCIWENAPLLI